MVETTPQASPPAKRTVLFVDDEPRVLTSMRAMFRREYDVLLANSGAEALELLARQHVDVIVSDQRMPGMTGVEMLKQVKERAPHAMRILLTGYADLQAVEASINEGEVFRYLTKPCPSDQLKAAIGLAAGIDQQEPPHTAPPAAARTAPPAAARTAPAAARTAPPAVTPAPSASSAAVGPQRIERAAPPGAAETAPAAAETAPATAKTAPHTPADVVRIDRPSARPVDVLLLSNDPAMVAVLTTALDGHHCLHAVSDLDAAVAVLERHPVGVLVTDTAIDEQAIASLTTTLKRHVPELVTIIASDRSDAQLLIELINYGQIFRFLLKPLHSGQCRLSIESAVQKHRTMAADPRQRMRHSVAEPAAAPASAVVGMFERIRRLRDRFFAQNGMA